MFGTQGFEFWWLIPLIMIGLCMFWWRGCCGGRRRWSDGKAEGNRQDEEIIQHQAQPRRDAMTTEKEDQTNGTTGKRPAMDCGMPQGFAKLMAQCRDGMEGECGTLMQEMMQRGCCQPKEK